MLKATVAASSLHPPYLEMICEAITGLKERTGSSQPAIAKFIEDKYNKALPPNFKKLLSVQLKKLLKSDKLLKVKNSYKLKLKPKPKPAIKIKDTHKNKGTNNNNNKEKAPTPRKIAEKISVKTKRLSQVKTPDALKKPTKELKQQPVSGSKVKRLSQVKTPETEGLKRKARTRSRKQ